ncbi:MAG TPA: hypothetical protein VFU00_11770 [Gemmatimonadales bacterium]|nr:hypothetical protein [Gemmatimonadales bacterium]
MTQRQRSARRPFHTLVLLALLGGCSHGEPFTAPDGSVDGPLVPGIPSRLTYSDAGATGPIWTPDGGSIVYSYVRYGGGFLVDDERCLGVLPAGGGTIGREICSRSVFATQSADAFDLPALSETGRLAFHHRGQPAVPTTAGDAILAATLDDPSTYTVVRSFPFQGDAFYIRPASLRWLGDSRLAFVGMAQEQIPPPCPECPPLLVEYAHQVLVADPAVPAVATAVPGTLYATSVSGGESADVIYFTLATDSRVFRLELGSGAVTTAHDFGPGVIARDVHFAAGRVVAVIEGRVLLHAGETRTVQGLDFGGRLHVAVPGTGAVAPVPAPPLMWFARPALSPDGSSVVAEGVPLRVDTLIAGGNIVAIDTTPIGTPSVWRLAAP